MPPRFIQWTDWPQPADIIDPDPEDDDRDEKWFVHTEGGMVPIVRRDDLLRHFRMVIMHTSFKLTRRLARILAREVEGVEMLDFASNYRARIGVARCWRVDQLQRSIEIALAAYKPPLLEGDYEPTDEQTSQMFASMTAANESFRYWTVCINAEGLETLGYSSLENYRHALADRPASAASLLLGTNVREP